MEMSPERKRGPSPAEEADREAEPSDEERRIEEKIDEADEESFPASDPPAWTPTGI